MQLRANGITLEVETTGPADAPALVLIRGLGSQLIHWPENLVRGLARAGFRVISFDNRDAGLSSRCPAPGVPTDPDEIAAHALADDVPPPAWRLEDMAQDVIGLLDALAIERAHVFGISMGGAIAQLLALEHPARLISASVVMSACRPLLERAHAAALLPRLLARPETRTEAQDNAVAADASMGSPGYPMPEAEIRALAARAWDRSHDHEGVNRQLLAIMAGRDLRPEIARVSVPTLVIHGRDDTLIPEPLGAEIAAHIPGAAYRPIAGMGHTITPALAPVIMAQWQGFVSALA